MKNLIKFLPFVIAIFMCFCLAFAGCADETGGQTSGNTDNGDGGGSDDTSGLGEVLIVYFSATGNTEQIAGYIADITGGTTFELEPVVPYTAEDLRYNDSNSRVYKERNDPSLRNVPLRNTSPENWEDYDTVFIGYPIWWQEASWVVDNFVKDNDFTGKTVVPFCTSASSPLGDSGTKLAQMAGSGEWKAGRRFSGSDSKSTVQTWLNGLTA